MVLDVGRSIDMRKIPILFLVIVMAVSMCVVFTSCRSTSCSLDGIVLSLDSYPTFILDNEATSSMNEDDLEDKQAVVSSLNRAIQDRPELGDMLEADMMDGGSNDYVYEGGESFFKVVGEFADENYSKARSMFPEITYDEFYYHTAYAYAVCNHDPELFEIAYVEFLNFEDYSVKYITPTFDQLMSTAFWTSYCSDRFGIDYYDDNSSFDGTFDCENLDCETTFELAVMLQTAVKESVMRGDIEIGSVKLASGDEIISKHLTEIQRKSLYDGGMKHVSLDDSDYFSQVGNVSNMIMINVDRLTTDTLESSALGYLGYASGMYLNRLYHGDIDLPWTITSGLCRSISMGPGFTGPIKNDPFGSEWCVLSWAHGNIDWSEFR